MLYRYGSSPINHHLMVMYKSDKLSVDTNHLDVIMNVFVLGVVRSPSDCHVLGVK